MASPTVKIVVALALYGGVVGLMLLPEEPGLLGSAGVVALTVVALALGAIGWVLNKLRIERANRAQRRLDRSTDWQALAEIGWLEDLHMMPATEPNRSNHIRTSERP